MKHAPTRRLRRFEPLSRLGDYKVERHQIDPRGWKVLSPAGRAVGQVKDLIVDTERMRTRYLDVELDPSAFDLHGDPHIMVSMEGARRDGNHDRLIVDSLTGDRMAELIEARARHIEAFWERWWSDDTATTRTPGTAAVIDSGAPIRQGSHLRQGSGGQASGQVGGTVSQDDWRRALEDVRPGEQVRIPVVEEEIVVERRPVTRGQ